MIGREYEHKLISSYLKSNRAELGIVYGRRRVGKSTLLRSLQSSVNKSLYFEGIKGLTVQAQISHFCKQLATQTQTMQVIAKSWQDAFDALAATVKKGRYYVVLDEFPWMASEKQELVSLLKYYWDNHLKSNPGLKLILCGSIAQFMVKHLVHSQALHNRKTFELKLGPLPCNEAALFLKKKRSPFETAKFLMVFGGIPKYLEQLNPNESLEKNIDRLCFKKGGFFLNEFETIFKEQFRVIKNYEAIVKALSKEKLTKEALAKKIKTTTGGGLTSYLLNLENAEFIRREPSINLKKDPKSKTVKYCLSDEWLRFYFNFMQPHLQAIKINQSEGLFDRVSSNSIHNYFGLSFENFCSKNIEAIIRALEIKQEDILAWGPYFKQGSRSDVKQSSGAQIDLLIKRRGNLYVLIECKFKDSPIDTSIITEIENKKKALGFSSHQTVEKVLIAANGVTPSVIARDYFHRILSLKDLLDKGIA